MGLDQQSYPAGQRGEDSAALLRRCDRWDISITSNAHTTAAWQRAYPCHYETLEIGDPRNDRLALATADDIEAVRASLGVRPHELVVLYAPTFREHHHAYSPVLDVEWLADELGSNTVVLQRVRYFYAADATMTHPRVRDVTGHPCVEDLLLAADVLITDYSSIMFDYAVLDRPIVIYAPDWDTFRRTRGVTFDLRAEPPGAFTESFAELVTAFRTGAVDGDAATKTRARFRERFCALDDGGASERAVRHVFASELDETIEPAEPAEPAEPGHEAPAAPPPGRHGWIAPDDWGEPETDEPESAPPVPTIIRPATPRTP
jgi:CDP-glycerol glycerophosphotransferase